MKHLFLTPLLLTALTAPAFAGAFQFDNAGFEGGDASAWTHESGTWNSSGTETLNNSHQGDSAVITGAGNTDSNTLGGLQQVLSGDYSYRLNNAANGAHFSTFSQSVTNYQSNDLYFGFAAILENPLTNPHTDAQTPKFSFTLFDDTANTALYSISFDSRDAVSQGITWHAGLNTSHDGAATWMFSDWNIVHIDTSLVYNHSLSLTVRAYDCALGGHGGYAYIDSFQPTPITPNAGVTVNQLNVTPDGVVNVSAVPETSTWVMGFLALGSVAYMLRRKPDLS